MFQIWHLDFYILFAFFVFFFPINVNYVTKVLCHMKYQQ